MKSEALKQAEQRAREAHDSWLIAEGLAGETFSEGKPVSTREQAMSEFEQAIERHEKKAA